MLLQYSFVVLPALLQHRSIVVQIIKQGADFNIVVLPLNTTPLSSMSSAVLCARQILCKIARVGFNHFVYRRRQFASSICAVAKHHPRSSRNLKLLFKSGAV
jgi:hypothetical protein